MILFVQIPCYNEENTLRQVINDIPKYIEGISKIEILVVDDGSTDNTVAVAKNLGVNHIVSLGSNRGLAMAFKTGIEYALEHGADILVNTDGDNQYCGHDIPALCFPILEGAADLVVGCRPIREHGEFTWAKKVFQLLGSWVLRKISKTGIKDAASGFRAFSRETLQRVFIHSRFSYCMETLIQAGNSKLRVASVDIRINPKTRESRLFTNVAEYIRKSTGTIIAMFVLYRPGLFFFLLSMPFWLLAFMLGFRALYMAWSMGGVIRDHMPSLFLLVISAVIAIIFDALAIIGELLKAQRRLTEEVLYLERKLRL